MDKSRTQPDLSSDASREPRSTLCILLLLALIAVVIGIAAHGPTNIYAYAQLWNVGSGIGMLESGNWLLPRNQLGVFARKPQLFPWIVAGIMKITGVCEDVTFRMPTILASFGTGVLIFLLARRWFNRRIGLMAACLWATGMHMSRIIYQATTDMLLTFWITLAIFCGDRLLFHPSGRSRRGRWLVTFWLAMILASLTKGWGIINFTIVGFMFVLAAVLRPGFGAAGRAETFAGRVLLAARLIWRRFYKVVVRTRLGWGVLAYLAVLGPVLVGMLAQGGKEFADDLYFEIWQRITGVGQSPPSGSTVPAAIYLIYSPVPSSLLALISLALVTPGRWFKRSSPISLPLCWVLAVVIPFSLTHAFRPDYLLPSYGALAIMGAWAVEYIARQGREAHRRLSLLRHACAAIAVLISLAIIVLPVMVLYREEIPFAIGKAFRAPAYVAAETWWVMAALPPIGLVLLLLAVRSSLKWQLRRVAAVTIVGMLGVLFMYTHFFSRHASSGVGERMRQFAHEVRPIVGDDAFAARRIEQLATELYLGRFGWRIESVEQLNQTACTWLITCDYGLSTLPARLLDGKPDAAWKIGHRPDELGEVVRRSPPLKTDIDWGHMYLIRLKPTIELLPASQPATSESISLPVSRSSPSSDRSE